MAYNSYFWMRTNTSTESQGCYNMTSEEFRTAKAVGVGVTSFTCLACAISILLIIFLRAYKSFLIRLVLYLNLTIFSHMLAEITQLLPVKYVNGTLVIHNRDICTATASIGVFFGGLAFLTQCSMALYLICLTTSKNKENLHSRAREICGVITAVVIAIVMATIPLIPFDGDTAYGIIGPFCWIKQKDPNCKRSMVGLIEHILLWDVPFGATVVFIIVALVLAVKVLCKKPQNHVQPSVQHMHIQGLQEARVLVVYMSILIILYLVASTVNILFVFSSGDDFDLFLSAFVIGTALFAAVPAAFVFHPATLKRLRCSEVKRTVNKWRGIRDDEVYTNYYVPQEPEFSECSDLVITGSHRNRHDSGYKTILMLVQTSTEVEAEA